MGFFFLPSLYLTGWGGQTCGRGHWSPWCTETAARSQTQSLAQSKMETWIIKHRVNQSAEMERKQHTEKKGMHEWSIDYDAK